MASIAWSDVLTQGAELSAVHATAQTDILAHVNTTLHVEDWGGEASPKLRLARIYLAAHFGALQILAGGGSGAAGPVTSESDGRLSRSYGWAGAMSGGDPLYDLTKYGRSYRTLMRPTFAGPRMF